MLGIRRLLEVEREGAVRHGQGAERAAQGDAALLGTLAHSVVEELFMEYGEGMKRMSEEDKEMLDSIKGRWLSQKEVAERIAEGPGSKTYGILSVLLQAWYDIEYLFTVGEGAFNPPPKVKSAVIRLVRNSRKELGCDESLFKAVVKTSFNQRRKTMRNSLRPIVSAKASREGWNEEQVSAFLSQPVFDLRPERLGVEDFISLTHSLQ